MHPHDKASPTPPVDEALGVVGEFVPRTAQGLAPRDLVEHGPAIQALLRTMVRDQDVEDLLQETWLRALSARSPRRAGLRAWLRGIASNLARDHWRRQGRRTRVERVVESEGSDAAEPAVDQTVVELEALRVLGGAVEALAEPYRSTIVLRYFRGLSVAEIAAFQRVEGANVRQRIRRGVTALRERLGERDRARLALLIPTIPWPAMTEPVRYGWWLGGILASVGAVLAAWGLGAFARSGDTIRPRVADAGLGVVARERADVEEPARSSGSAERSTPVPGAAVVTVRGRTVGPDGAPVGEVELFAWRAPDLPPEHGIAPRVVSDREGWFEVDVESPGFLLGTREPASTLRGALLRASLVGEIAEVVVAQVAEVVVRIEAASGRAAAEARLDLHWEPLRRFPRVLSSSFVPFHGVRAIEMDSAGQTFLVRGPRGREASLEASAGLETASAPMPSEDRSELSIRLSTPTAVFTFDGRVVDAGGRPVAGARVGIVGASAADITEADGRYRIAMGSDRLSGHHRDLYAAAPGSRPHIARGVVQQVLLASGSQSFETTLQLEPALAPLAGRVVDAAGEPLAGIVVRPWNRTLLGAGDRDSLEDLAAGGEHGAAARTGPDGRFQLGGLDDRGYRLVCSAPGGRWPLVTRSDWRPGGFAELVFDAQAELRALSGVVRDHAGRPLPGVRIGAVMNLAADPVGRIPVLRALVGFTSTLADGSFEFPDVPRIGVRLQLHAPGYLPLAVPADRTLRDHLADLVMPARAGLHARGLGDDARWIRVEDREGRVRTLHRSDLDRRDADSIWPVVNGDVEVLECAPGEASLVVLDVRHREVARIPVALRPGRVVVVSR